MKNLFPIAILILSMYIYSCANQMIPTGGPKDTIPPTLIETFPSHKSVNYQDKTFKLKFDERINVDKLKQSLIITPYTENKYQFKIKKNELTLIFEDSFDSLTTYTLNFGNGVTDITEKTPAVNLKLAFSTGPIIDSIYIQGNVKNLYTNVPLDKITIALFDENDTLDIFTGKPKYFALSDEEGFFLIENIKNGFYKIYAFEDANNNMINEPDEEPHGFIFDPIDLSISQENVDLKMQLLDTRPLKLNRGKFTGTYFDLNYNKFVTKYAIHLFNNPLKLPLPKNNLINDNTSIRFYRDSLFRYEKDSIGLIINAEDSLQNQTTDTVFVQFRESKRKLAAFQQSLTPPNKRKINRAFKLKMTFNKPIAQFNNDSIRFQYDTLLYEFISDTLFYWNDNKTEFSFKYDLDPKLFKLHLDSLIMLHSDTTNKDSTEINIRKYLKRLDTLRIDLIIPKSAFVSVEQDSSKRIKNSYFYKKPSDYGSVNGKVSTTHPNYTLQLVSTTYDVIQQIKNPKQYNFKQVPPGTYTLRVLIDSNNDGTWGFGNIHQGREPEQIYFYPEKFDIRANWQLDNINISF